MIGLKTKDADSRIIDCAACSQYFEGGRAPNADVIPAAVHKVGVLPMAEKVSELFHCMWRKEAIPQEFKDAYITENKMSTLILYMEIRHFVH